MIDPTVISVDSYRSVQRLKSWIFEIPSIPIGGTSDEIRFNIGETEGAIAAVRIACASADYDLSIREIKI